MKITTNKRFRRADFVFFAVSALIVAAVFMTGALGKQKVWPDMPYGDMRFTDGKLVWDTANGDDYDLISEGPGYALPAGKYRVQWSIESDGENVMHITSGNGARITPSEIALPAGELYTMEAEFELLDSAGNVQLQVEFREGTHLQVYSVRLYSPEYSDHAITLLLCTLALWALLILYRMGYLTPRRRGRLIFLGLAVLIVSAPIFKDNLVKCFDTDFHMARINNLADGLRTGQFPVRLGGYSYNGYGAITSVFYPDVFLYPAALARLAGASIQYAMHLTMFEINVLTALCMYWAASRLFEDEDVGLCAAILYVCAIYRITDIYSRGGIGEALGMCFLPIFVYGLWSVLCGDKDRWPVLSIGAALVFMCHMITTLLCALIAVGMGAVCIVKVVREHRVMPVVKACMLAGLLCAWQIVPLLMYSMQGIGASEIKVDMSLCTIAPAQLLLLGEGDMAVDPYDTTLSGMALEIGLPLLCGAAMALYAQAAGKKGKNGHAALMFAAVGSAAAMMTTTLFPWAHISLLTGGVSDYIQFPWRLLMMTSVFFAFAGAYGFMQISGTNKEQMTATVLMIAMLCALPTISQETRRNDTVEFGRCEEPALHYGEYQIPGTDVSGVADRLPRIEGDAALAEYEKDGSCVTAQVDAQGDAAVTLPLFGFDGYAAEVDGKAMELTLGENNRLMVLLPAGTQGELIVRFKGKTIWRIADLISLATAAGMAVLYRKRKKATSV